jgi:hypothetical protein
MLSLQSDELHRPSDEIHDVLSDETHQVLSGET